MTETLTTEAQSPHTPTRKTITYSTDKIRSRSGSRSSLRLVNKSARFSGRLRNFFEMKQKKTSESHISLMYAGTLSCPLFSHPVEELEEEETQERMEEDVLMEEKSPFVTGFGEIEDSSNKLMDLLNSPSYQTPKGARHQLPSTLQSRILPALPPNTPLSAKDAIEYGLALEIAVSELQNDFTSGARQLADTSLSHLLHITEIGAPVASSWGEFWATLVHAAKQFSQARPSMSAAITSCLLRTLERIARRWNEEQEDGVQGTAEFANLARGMLDEIQQERREISTQLGESFTFWLKNHYTQVPTVLFGSSPIIPPKSPLRSTPRRTIRILTLSNSSTIRTAILHALAWLTEYDFHVTILESRPRCEGADMAAQILLATTNRDRLSVLIVPDCAIGTASRNIDIVLLGADRISSTGDVSNKIGSLAAAMCAKQQNPSVTVAVVSDTDKIAAPRLEEGASESHPSRELSSAWVPDTRNQLEGKNNVEVFGEWFEWVPARLVDVYVTELGGLELGDVERVAREIGELDEYIFQAQKE